MTAWVNATIDIVLHQAQEGGHPEWVTAWSAAGRTSADGASHFRDTAVLRARDAALMARIRDNDELALAELTRAYAVPLANHAVALLHSNAAVEDVVQDVFFDLWTRRATLEIPDNVAGYLRRAVQYRAVSVLRHEEAQQRLVARARVVDVDHARVAYNSAEQRLDDADLEVQLHRALAEVPLGPRNVFLLSWSGLTYQEIADTLGLTIGSVRVLMYRATRRLSASLSRQSP